VDNDDIRLDDVKFTIIRVIVWSIVMSVADKVLARAPLLDPDEIERNIEDMIQGNLQGIDRRPAEIHAVSDVNDIPLPKGPMPDYVEHKQGVNQVGKLSAEAVVREYDAAVKEIEALGKELSDAARKCEAMVAGVHAMVAEIKELAARYRDEGKRYFLQIEECSLMTSEVRTVCEALKKKIAAGNIAA
jgi:hypothetical protein